MLCVSVFNLKKGNIDTILTVTTNHFPMHSFQNLNWRNKLWHLLKISFKLPLPVRLLWTIYVCSLLYPPLQRSWKGGILVSPCPSVRLSICGHNRVRSVSSTILVGSISYIHILSSNFRRCAAYKVCITFTNTTFWQIIWFCNFDFVFFWLGIQYESVVWVIMRRRGYPQHAGSLVVLVFIVLTQCHEKHMFAAVQLNVSS